MLDEQAKQNHFTGNVYVFQAFDLGDDINLDLAKQLPDITVHTEALPKYFKGYHTPLSFSFNQTNESPYATLISAKLYNFGALSLTYRMPFNDTLEGVRKNLEKLDSEYDAIALLHAETIFNTIKHLIIKPNFFHTKSSYVLIQVDPQPNNFDTVQLKDVYGGVIASTLRFETETLSEYQKNEILQSAFGYYRGDLIVVDTEAAFAYDDEYQELMDFIEFANIQHLELRYFDRTLNQQLNYIYEGRTRKVSFKAYLPFIGTLTRSPIDELWKLKVDISVIIERLEGSIRLVGDPYYSELYALLIEKRELKALRESIDKKLSIVKDVLSSLQKKIDAVRNDMLTISIIGLILIELVIGLLSYLK